MPGAAWAVELNRGGQRAVQDQQLPGAVLIAGHRIQHHRIGVLCRAVEAGNDQVVMRQLQQLAVQQGPIAAVILAVLQLKQLVLAGAQPAIAELAVEADDKGIITDRLGPPGIEEFVFESDQVDDLAVA